MLSESAGGGLKTTVAHENDMVAGVKLAFNLLQHIIHPGNDLAATLQRCQCYFRIPVNTITRLEPYVVGSQECGPQFIGVYTGAHGIAAWLECDQDAGITYFTPQTFQRKPDCGGMMGKIIIDMDIQ